MRWLFPRRGVCGSELRRGLPVGRFYLCDLREAHRGDHFGRLHGSCVPRGDGVVLELDRVAIWQRRL